jgi:hypothetical protein
MIYYRTVFYNNIYDTTKFIVLGNTTTKCIGEAEKSRGYISREDLVLFYDCPIEQEDISEYSRVVEYITTSPDGVEKVENFRIKVK